MKQYEDFKASVLGKIVDDGKGTYKGQCVSLVKRWIAYNGWPYKHGNAIDWQNNGDNFYKWVPNTPTGVPVQGDMIVLKVGTYGDIAIVESANVKTYDALGQNYPKGNLTDPVQVRRASYTKPPVVGWLHPTVLDVVTPVVEPTPPTPVVTPPPAPVEPPVEVLPPEPVIVPVEPEKPIEPVTEPVVIPVTPEGTIWYGSTKIPELTWFTKLINTIYEWWKGLK